MAADRAGHLDRISSCYRPERNDNVIRRRMIQAGSLIRWTGGVSSPDSARNSSYACVYWWQDQRVTYCCEFADNCVRFEDRSDCDL